MSIIIHGHKACQALDPKEENSSYFTVGTLSIEVDGLVIHGFRVKQKSDGSQGPSVFPVDVFDAQARKYNPILEFTSEDERKQLLRKLYDYVDEHKDSFPLMKPYEKKEFSGGSGRSSGGPSGGMGDALVKAAKGGNPPSGRPGPSAAPRRGQASTPAQATAPASPQPPPIPNDDEIPF